MEQSFQIPITLLENKSTDSDVQVIPGTSLLEDIEKQAFELFRQSVDNIKLIRQKYISVTASSFGKDSTCLTLASLTAHTELIDEGYLAQDAPFVLTNINTGVENHLVQMLSLDQIDALKSYAARKNINIDIRVGTPPLSKQWAALFLSGIKIISSARVNNDCSVLMKVDTAEKIEREVARDYGENVVTLLGSRISESSKRAASLRKHGTDQATAESLIEIDDNNDKVFAPIIDLDDDHVWTLLRRAGLEALQPSSLGFANIPSYTKNHRLLNIIYADSKSGSCPTSSKQIKGESRTIGGCGGSARTGCYLCAKGIIDKSGEAQSTQRRHSIISGNILKVRNYIMSVAQDINYRTWQSRAVDATTGDIALQPSVLNTQTTDKLMWLLCQATWDEKNRADRFADLLAKGREMEDEGYADIMLDPALDEEDRQELARVYKKYATQTLISPMSLELALFLSVVHSRDGLKLPPYRALHIWIATSRGERIPYPDVDPTKAVIDDIPDSVMVVPHQSATAQYFNTTGGLSSDRSKQDQCYSKAILNSSRMPVYQAKFYLPDSEQHILLDKKPSDLVVVTGVEKTTLTQKLRIKPLSITARQCGSKRAIKKIRRTKGSITVLERGRTSLASPSFGHRTSDPHLLKKLCSPVHVYLPTSNRSYSHFTRVLDNKCDGYQFDSEALENWMMCDGINQALRLHDDFVQQSQQFNESIYCYGGCGPFEEMSRWGLLQLNKRAHKNAIRILARTNYFSSIGLLSIDDKAIMEIALTKSKTHNLRDYRPGIKTKSRMRIDKILPMHLYRQYKAQILLALRQERNANRKMLKLQHSALINQPIKSAIDQLQNVYEAFKNTYSEAVETEILIQCLLKVGVSDFDGRNFHNLYYTNKGFRRYFYALFSEKELMLNLFDRPVRQRLLNNPQDRQKLLHSCGKISKILMNAEMKILNDVLHKIREQQRTSIYYHLINSNVSYKDAALRVVQNRIDEEVPMATPEFKQMFSVNDSIATVDGIKW